jgi:methionyl-tRNA formyltransferase
MEVDVKYVILTSEVLEDRFRQEIKNSDLPIENFVFAYNLEQLVSYFKKSSTVKFLISFSTSTIVPKWLINKLNGCAVNIHAASPQYPGRDPHHYAIYDQASEYGATMHYMTEKVDDGIIIDVEFFKVFHRCVECCQALYSFLYVLGLCKVVRFLYSFGKFCEVV